MFQVYSSFSTNTVRLYLTLLLFLLPAPGSESVIYDFEPGEATFGQCPSDAPWEVVDRKYLAVIGVKPNEDSNGYIIPPKHSTDRACGKVNVVPISGRIPVNVTLWVKSKISASNYVRIAIGSSVKTFRAQSGSWKISSNEFKVTESSEPMEMLITSMVNDGILIVDKIEIGADVVPEKTSTSVTPSSSVKPSPSSTIPSTSSMIPSTSSTVPSTSSTVQSTSSTIPSTSSTVPSTSSTVPSTSSTVPSTSSTVPSTSSTVPSTSSIIPSTSSTIPSTSSTVPSTSSTIPLVSSTIPSTSSEKPPSEASQTFTALRTTAGTHKPEVTSNATTLPKTTEESTSTKGDFDLPSTGISATFSIGISSEVPSTVTTQATIPAIPNFIKTSYIWIIILGSSTGSLLILIGFFCIFHHCTLRLLCIKREGAKDDLRDLVKEEETSEPKLGLPRVRLNSFNSGSQWLGSLLKGNLPPYDYHWDSGNNKWTPAIDAQEQSIGKHTRNRSISLGTSSARATTDGISSTWEYYP